MFDPSVGVPEVVLYFKLPLPVVRRERSLVGYTSSTVTRTFFVFPASSTSALNSKVAFLGPLCLTLEMFEVPMS